ncbi:MAG: DegT/DnrJ/EryC1/StrS family aminotransferase [Minisyncoccia bacterium]
MKIPLSSPDITEKEKKAVLAVLDSSRLSLGPRIVEFERKFAGYIGTKYAIAISSGTAGLHLLVRALEIKGGDEVITTPFSFIASANCVLFEKAKPAFVDIDPKTLNIDADKIEKAITLRTKAIIAVDVFGHSAEWQKILKIARKFKLRVIEDSCEAIGAEYQGRKCGSFGDAAVFAFYPNKQITTGEGGMIVTDNKKIAELCRSMLNQGRKIKNGSWLDHVRLGYNYRMSDINAALGIAQLSRIEEILQKRNKVAKYYKKHLLEIQDIEIPHESSWAKISWFVYVVKLSKKYTANDRNEIIGKMRNLGIECSDYFKCIHLQPFYRESFGFKKGDFPIAESISDRTIALPFFNNLKEEKIKYIVNKLKTCL